MDINTASEEEKAWNKKRANSRKSRTAGSVEEFMKAQKHEDDCDHEWIWIDDSFDTGMGYDHKCGHGECSKCGESKD